ncbi:MAG TPA: pitrilysin family protein [Symbiobacteriaceae bacterium]|nr:pitrilysin family protein [Symbiobacteriaceae bacterium]
MTLRFSRHELAEGVNLFVGTTEKFKTTVIYAYFHTPLHPEWLTPNALLPLVLARGSADYPTMAELQQHLDELYGASFGIEISRRGEVHSIIFRIEVPNEHYLPDSPHLLEEAIKTLSSLITKPLVEGDGFQAAIFEQERTNLQSLIEGLINEKRRWALHRCTEAMCEGEAYALNRLGRVEDLPGITPQSLLRHHKRMLEEATVNLFVIGNVEEEQVKGWMDQYLQLPAGARTMPETVVKREVGREPKKVTDSLDVNQGVLAIGFRTGTTVRDEDYFPLIVANGVFGGFPHSKLFQEVREKNSLAYFAYSNVETVKGVGFMYAGIEFEDRDQCQEIMLEQLKVLQSGQVSDEELETTKRQLVNDILSSGDSPAALADLAIDRVFSGVDRTVEERVAAVEAVTKEQVAAVAQKFQIDTVYFLTNKAGEGGEAQ